VPSPHEAPYAAALRQPSSARAEAHTLVVSRPTPGFARLGAASRPPRSRCCPASAEQLEGRGTHTRGAPGHTGLRPAGSGVAPCPFPLLLRVGRVARGPWHTRLWCSGPYRALPGGELRRAVPILAAAPRQPSSAWAVAHAHAVLRPMQGFARRGAASRPPLFRCCSASAEQRESCGTHSCGALARLRPEGSGVTPSPSPLLPRVNRAVRGPRNTRTWCPGPPQASPGWERSLITLLLRVSRAARGKWRTRAWCPGTHRASPGGERRSTLPSSAAAPRQPSSARAMAHTLVVLRPIPGLARRGAASRLPSSAAALRQPSSARAVAHTLVVPRTYRASTSGEPRCALPSSESAAAPRQPSSARAVAHAHVLLRPTPGLARRGTASRPPLLRPPPQLLRVSRAARGQRHTRSWCSGP